MKVGKLYIISYLHIQESNSQPDLALSLLSSALLFRFVLLPRTYTFIEIVKHVIIPTQGLRPLAVAAGRHGGRGPGEQSQVPEVEDSFAFLYLQSGANQMTEAKT